MRRFNAETAPETHAIIAAAIEVQRHLGTGLLESAYGDALELEFGDRGIAFERERPVQLTYKGRLLRTRYRADFVCAGTILLELKAASTLVSADLAQLGHYLGATGLHVGLLFNFGHAPLQIRRFVHGRVEIASPDSVDSVSGPQTTGPTL